MGIATLLRILLRAGKAKKAAKAFRSAKKLSKIPQKSKGMPGVSRRVTPKRPTYKYESPVGSDKWKRQVSDDVREFTRKHGLGPKGKWKNKLTPEQTAIVRRESLKEQRMIDSYKKQQLEDVRKHGTPMQQDWDEYMRSLREELAYFKNKMGEF